MDLARLLTPQSDDDSSSDTDASRRPSVLSSPTDVAKVSATALARRRRSRQELTLERLRDQVQSLEWIHSNANAIFKDAPPTVDAVNPDAKRLRRYFQKAGLLQSQLLQEQRIRSQYLEQLKHSQHTAAAVRKLMRGMELDEWFWKCDRWRSITAEYFKPFSRSHCERLVYETLDAIKLYKMPKEITGNKPSVFGWRDVRGLGGDLRSVHFNTRKTYCGPSIDDTVATFWSIFQDCGLFKHFILGDRVQLHFETLQHVTPASLGCPAQDILIIQSIEQYPGIKMLYHSLYIVFFMKTKTGYMISMRCIPSPDLQRAMLSEGMSESCTFFWSTWDVVRTDEETGECIEFETRVNGFIGSTDPAYARIWVLEGLLALVRLEEKLYGAQPIGLPSVVS